MNGIETIMMATGIDEKKLAQILGVSKPTVQRWIQGEMSSTTIRTLSQYFKVSYQFLFGDSAKSGNEDIDRLINLVTEVKRIRERNEWQ